MPADGVSPNDKQTSYLQTFAMGTDVDRIVRGRRALAGSASPGGTTMTIGRTGPAVTVRPLFPPADPTYPDQVEARTRPSPPARSSPSKSRRSGSRTRSLCGMRSAPTPPQASSLGYRCPPVKFLGLFSIAPAQISFMPRL